MLTAQVEDFSASLVGELMKQFPAHYEELSVHRGKVPLSPQYGEYRRRADAGELLIVTLRERGALLGYFVGFISPGLHYSTCLTYIMDICRVTPEQRERGGGTLLVQRLKDELRRRAVKLAFVGCKAKADLGPFYEKLGFELSEKTYALWLDDGGAEGAKGE